jgi:MoxR-like ATPase
MIVKEMEKMQGELASTKAELVKVLAGSEEAKAQIVALAEAKANAEKLAADAKAEADKAALEAKEQNDKLVAEGVKLSEEVVQLKAKLALIPMVSEGTQPVAEGGEGQPKVSFIERLNKLHGAEMMAFRKQHKEEIEAERKQLQK